MRVQVPLSPSMNQYDFDSYDDAHIDDADAPDAREQRDSAEIMAVEARAAEIKARLERLRHQSSTSRVHKPQARKRRRAAPQIDQRIAERKRAEREQARQERERLKVEERERKRAEREQARQERERLKVEERERKRAEREQARQERERLKVEERERKRAEREQARQEKLSQYGPSHRVIPTEVPVKNYYRNECANGHLWTEDTTRWRIRKDKGEKSPTRDCLVCKRQSEKRRRAKRAAEKAQATAC